MTRSSLVRIEILANALTGFATFQNRDKKDTSINCYRGANTTFPPKPVFAAISRITSLTLTTLMSLGSISTLIWFIITSGCTSLIPEIFSSSRLKTGVQAIHSIVATQKEILTSWSILLTSSLRSRVSKKTSVYLATMGSSCFLSRSVSISAFEISATLLTLIIFFVCLHAFSQE